MTDTPTLQLLHDLVARFTAHPEAIEIAAQPTAGACLWLMKGHPEDDGKLVGIDGIHVKALTFLIAKIGRARGETHTFRLITTPSDKKGTRGDRKAVLTYDPEPLVELLNRLLTELPIADFRTSVGPGSGARDVLKFEFTITVRAGADFQALTVPDESGQSIVGALGILYAAIAKNSGVDLSIVVAPLLKPAANRR